VNSSTSQETRKPRGRQGPKRGTKWHRAAANGRGFVISKPAETRHVIDRTWLAGDVIFVSGRLTGNAPRRRCTLTEWLDWQSEAIEVTPSCRAP
jgi:hypothetical protein